MALYDRAVGAMAGLALGDAYGRPLEFLKGRRVREQNVAILPGSLMWTDDTHMSLYLGKALLDLRPGRWDEEAFGAALAARWVEWLHDPLMPSTAPGGTCLAGARAIENGTPWRKSGVPTSDGCGAVMRICPLPIALDGPALTTAAKLSALTTHGHPNAVEAAIAGCWLLRWVLEEGELSAELVQRAVERLRGDWGQGGDVAKSLEDALKLAESSGEWLEEEKVHPGDGGWRSGSALGLAIAAALRWGDDFARAVDRAARIDGDSDSVACLTGMFLGAARGRGFLPPDWRDALVRRDEIERLAGDLVLWGEGNLPNQTAAPTAAPTARARTSFTDPIEVAWLPGTVPGRIGLTFAPGKRSGSLFGSPWHRDLGADLDRLRASHRVDLLVPLVEDFELRDLGISRLVEEAEARGMVVGRLAIPDGGIPPLEEARRIVQMILAFARAGRVAVVHCRGGLGRAGTLAACSLTRQGYRPADAIAAVRKVRPGALENSGQEDFVHLFANDVSRE